MLAAAQSMGGMNAGGPAQVSKSLIALFSLAEDLAAGIHPRPVPRREDGDAHHATLAKAAQSMYVCISKILTTTPGYPPHR